MDKYHGNEDKAFPRKDNAAYADDSGTSEVSFFWEKLGQYQSLSRDSWNEYFKALKSLEEEKLEVHRLKMKTLAQSEEIRAEMAELDAKLISLCSKRFESAPKSTAILENSLPVLETLQNTLDNLSSKEGTSFAKDKLSTEEPTISMIESDRKTPDDNLVTIEIEVSRNGNADEKGATSHDLGRANKEFEEAKALYDFASAEWNKACIEQNIELSKLHEDFVSETKLLEKKIEEAEKNLESLSGLEKSKWEAESEMECLKYRYEVMINSRMDLLEKGLTLAEEKYALRKEKVILGFGTSFLEDSFIFADKKMNLGIYKCNYNRK